MKTLLHTIKFLFRLDTPESQVTDQELQTLIKYLPLTGVVVELGCYEGKTTAHLARNSNGIVYTIDPFPRGRLGFSYGERIAKTYCRRQGRSNVRFLKGLSYDHVSAFREAIDFIFIDADHSFEAITRDWEDWYPKVKSGGIIALHDSRQAANSPEYLGSMKFYDTYLPGVAGVNEIDGVDSLSVFRVE
jgi:predicted O-methyltransferase YrrM